MAAASMAMTAAALIGDVPGCWGCCLVAHALRCVALPCLALRCVRIVSLSAQIAKSLFVRLSVCVKRSMTANVAPPLYSLLFRLGIGPRAIIRKTKRQEKRNTNGPPESQFQEKQVTVAGTETIRAETTTAIPLGASSIASTHTVGMVLAAIVTCLLLVSECLNSMVVCVA